MGLCLPLMKASNLALLMVNCFVLHLYMMVNKYLGLIKEYIWVLLMADLIVIVKLILRFHCLITHLDKMIVLHFYTLVVFLVNLKKIFLSS